jgi:hypothetical protein
VDQVIDHTPGSNGASTLEQAGRDQNLLTVANGGAHFAPLMKLADKRNDTGILAQFLGGQATRDDDAIEFICAHLFNRHVGMQIPMVFASVFKFAIADNHYLCPSLPHAETIVVKLDLIYAPLQKHRNL